MNAEQRKLNKYTIKLWAQYDYLKDQHVDISWKCTTLDMDYSATGEVSRSHPSEEIDTILSGIQSDLQKSEELKMNIWLKLCMTKHTLKTQHGVSEQTFTIANCSKKIL